MTEHLCSHLSRRQALLGATGVTASAALGGAAKASADTKDPAYPSSGDSRYRVTHYQIGDTILTGAGRIFGATTMTAVAEQALTSIQVDFQLTPDRVLVDGKPATYSAVTTTSRGNGRFTVSGFAVAAGQRFTVTVGYNQPMTTRATSALYRTSSTYAVAGEPLAATQWFACNDRLDVKATYDISISTEATNRVLLHNPVARSSYTSGKTAMTNVRFTISEPSATYQLGIAVGPFVVQQGTWTIGGRAVPFHVGALAGLSASTIVTHTPRTLTYFAARYGAFPFNHAGGVLLSNTNVGAQETLGGPTYDNGCNTAAFVAHENAHMWFGNSVTATTWDDVVLIQEGLATLLEWDYLVSIGRSAADMWSPPIVPPSGAKIPRTMTVTREAYGHAAGLMQMLRVEMDGSTLEAKAPRFRSFLHTLATTYRYGHITRAQFKAEAAKAAGKDLAPFWRRYGV